MIRGICASWLAVIGVFLAGCQTTRSGPTPPPVAPLIARFYLETKAGEPGLPVTLPQSGVVLQVGPRPVLVEHDITNAEVAEVELGRCLLVQLSPAAARDLYRLTVSALGRRLVLALNDQFMGARPIDAPITDGRLLIFLETTDDRLPHVVERLKATADQMAANARKSRKP